MSDLLPGVFPDDRRAAISLTYDDGLAEHLDLVIPQLESFGLRGTFYVPTRYVENSSWTSRSQEWASAARRGHEIANHTQYHPCGGEGRDWVKPNFRLEAYSPGRMESELIGASADIRATVGDQGPHSYAYTCGDDWVGPQRSSYRPIVSRLFPAARSASPGLADPYECDLSFVPAWAMFDTTPRTDVLRWIDEAIERGRWAVLIFHGVGGGHSINVSPQFHLEIVDHVVRHRDRLWCDTFLKVALLIRSLCR
jgi:sialate O-acetylesterase